MRAFIHTGVNPHDTALLKATIRNNRKQLRTEGWIWSPYRSEHKKEIAFGTPRPRYKKLKLITRQAKCKAGCESTLILFLDISSLMRSGEHPKEIDRVLESQGFTTIWTLAFGDPYEYFYQTYSLNAMTPGLQTPYSTSFVEAARIACKRGYISSPSRDGYDMHIFDYQTLLKKLADATRKTAITFRSAEVNSLRVDKTSPFINWVLGVDFPLKKENRFGPQKDIRYDTVPEADSYNIQRILTRKLLRDTGSKHKVDGQHFSNNALIDAITDQNLWQHLHDVQQAKKMFREAFSDWREVHNTCQHWSPAYRDPV